MKYVNEAKWETIGAVLLVAFIVPIIWYGAYHNVYLPLAYSPEYIAEMERRAVERETIRRLRGDPPTGWQILTRGYYGICSPLLTLVLVRLIQARLRYRRNWARPRQAYESFQCSECGYDTRASWDRCPECGNAHIRPGPLASSSLVIPPRPKLPPRKRPSRVM